MCVGSSSKPKVDTPAAAQYAPMDKLAPMKLSAAAMSALQGLGTTASSLRIGESVPNQPIQKSPMDLMKNKQLSPAGSLKI